MNTQLNELVEYIKKARVAGQQDQQSKQILIKNGWTDQEIQEAFAIAFAEPKVQPRPEPQLQPQPQQPAQPQIQPQVFQSMGSARVKKNPALKIFTALILSFLIVGAVIAGAILAWNFFRQDPEKILGQALNNVINAKSENFDAEFYLNGADTDIAAKASGSVDFPNRLLNGQGSFEYLEPNASKAFVAGEARNIGNNFYFKLGEFDMGELDVFLSEKFDIDSSKISGNWVKLENNFPINNEPVSKIAEIAMKNKIFDIKALPDVQGDEGPEFHYAVSLNRENFNMAFPEIYQVVADRADLSGYSLEWVKTEINSRLNEIGEISAEVFILKSSGNLKKVQMMKNGIKNESGAEYKISFKADISEINKPVQVLPPEQFVVPSELADPSAIVFENMQKIAQAAQQYLQQKSSYIDFCKAGYLNGDVQFFGPQLVEASKNIVKQQAKRLICYTSAQKYCASAQLKDGTWICASNSAPGLGSVKCASPSTICK